MLPPDLPPEILVRIGALIDRKTLPAACLVSKTWLNCLRPFLWRAVNLDEYLRGALFALEFSRYYEHVRKVSFTVPSPQEFTARLLAVPPDEDVEEMNELYEMQKEQELKDLGPSYVPPTCQKTLLDCNRLEYVSVVYGQEMVHRSAPSNPSLIRTSKRMAHFAKAVDRIITCNISTLRTLKVYSLPDQIDIDICDNIEYMKHLESLTLAEWIFFDTGILYNLLQAVKPSLRTLSLEMNELSEPLEELQDWRQTWDEFQKNKSPGTSSETKASKESKSKEAKASLSKIRKLVLDRSTVSMQTLLDLGSVMPELRELSLKNTSGFAYNEESDESEDSLDNDMEAEHDESESDHDSEGEIGDFSEMLVQGILGSQMYRNIHANALAAAHAAAAAGHFPRLAEQLSARSSANAQGTSSTSTNANTNTNTDTSTSTNANANANRSTSTSTSTNRSTTASKNVDRDVHQSSDEDDTDATSEDSEDYHDDERSIDEDSDDRDEHWVDHDSDEPDDGDNAPDFDDDGDFDLDRALSSFENEFLRAGSNRDYPYIVRKMRQLHQYCPLIQSFDFSDCRPEGLDEKFFSFICELWGPYGSPNSKSLKTQPEKSTNIVAPTSPGLMVLLARNCCSFKSPFFDLVLYNCGRTLTELDLSMGPACRKMTRVNDQIIEIRNKVYYDGILSILSTCANLKVLHVEPYPINARAIARQEHDWACKNIRMLSICIEFDHQPGPFQPVAEAEREIQIKTCKQLGKLTHLESLTLEGGRPPAWDLRGLFGMGGALNGNRVYDGQSKRRYLALSLENGLGELAGLTHLENLYIVRLGPHSLREAAEVEWLGSHWPALRRIDGFWDWEVLRTRVEALKKDSTPVFQPIPLGQPNAGKFRRVHKDVRLYDDLDQDRDAVTNRLLELRNKYMKVDYRLVDEMLEKEGMESVAVMEANGAHVLGKPGSVELTEEETKKRRFSFYVRQRPQQPSWGPAAGGRANDELMSDVMRPRGGRSPSPLRTWY
ncbi:hypothetical protein BGZ54_002748 [Gamsiella multidivaricata]|nr:hypothetical protein BGZ54_002748 [Gamsiella multidivaricata]